MYSEKLIPTFASLFFTKNDPSDPRIGEIAKPVDLAHTTFEKNETVIIGYPDDDGIKLNGGRPGSADGPKLIRQFLYRMTPALNINVKPEILDIGDISLNQPLNNRQEQARKIITYLQHSQCKTISLGGGHDYGYSDTCGFIESNLDSDSKPMVINFDAHLDVRPNQNGNNSGTPFYRMLKEFHQNVNFVEIGIQSQCNSQAHYDWALQHSAKVYDLNWIENKGLMSLFNEKVFRDLTLDTPVFISFDIDALTASEAGGCSQAWATGLRINETLKFLSVLYKRCKAQGLGIYEVSPLLDRDFQTSKTAALIAHHFIYES